MPTTTSNQQIPLPTETDDPDIPTDLNTLALFIEKQLVGIYASTADRDSRETSPKEGQVAFTKDADKWWYYNGTAWAQLFIPTTAVPTFTISTSLPSGGSNGDIWYKI